MSTQCAASSSLFWKLLTGANMLRAGYAADDWPTAYEDLISDRVTDICRSAGHDVGMKVIQLTNPELYSDIGLPPSLVDQLQKLRIIADYDAGTATAASIEAALGSRSNSKLLQVLCNLPDGLALWTAAEVGAKALKKRDIAVAAMVSHVQELDLALRDSKLSSEALTKACRDAATDVRTTVCFQKAPVAFPINSGFFVLSEGLWPTAMFSDVSAVYRRWGRSNVCVLVFASSGNAFLKAWRVCSAKVADALTDAKACQVHASMCDARCV